MSPRLGSPVASGPPSSPDPRDREPGERGEEIFGDFFFLPPSPERGGPAPSHRPDVSGHRSEDLPEARSRRVQREKPALGSLGGPPTSSCGSAPTLLRGKATAPTLGGCPPPIQFPLQCCSHLEPPPHLEDPDHRPCAGSAASRDLCLCNCLGVARGLLPSPIPRASLTLSPCRIIPLPPHPDSGKDQLCTP